jgi:hypothetical protein
MRSRINSTLLGSIIGFVAPIIAVLLFFVLKYQARMNLEEFIDSLFVLNIYSHVMAIGVYAGNLAFFTLFIKTDLLKAARGVLLVTIIYSFVIAFFRLGL